MPFRIRGFSGRLRRQAGDRSDGALITLADLLDKLDDTPLADWWQVRVADGPARGAEGFMPVADLEEVVLVPMPVEIDQLRFFQELSLNARIEGAPREYLFATAFFESGGIRNVGSKLSSAFGPFQFLAGTWAGLVQSDGQRTGIGLADRTDPFKQCVFAAIHTAQALTKAIAALGRVPTGAELYLLHLLGHSGGSAALRGKPNAAIQASAEQIAANPGLLLQGGKTATLAQVRKAVEAKLAPGHARCAELIAAFEPEVPRPAAGTLAAGDPPWLGKAMTQLGVREVVAKGARNPEVDKFFSATHAPGLTDDDAWCAAFVAWCLANAGDPAAVASNLGSVRAATWIGWGKPRTEPLRGSLGVTAPLAPGSSGHVGFVTAVTPTRITLLAGNQGNAVSEMGYDRKMFVAFRDLRG